MKKIILALAILLSSCSIASCSQYNDQRGKGDAPVENRKGDDKPAVVINFPDSFQNIAIKCYGGTAILTHTREAAPVVIPDSTLCNGDEVAPLDGES